MARAIDTRFRIPWESKRTRWSALSAKTDSLQRLCRSLAWFLQAKKPPVVNKVLQTGQIVVQKRLVAHHPNPLPHRIGTPAKVITRNFHQPGIGLDLGGQNAQQRRLACPVRAQQTQALAPSQRKIQPQSTGQSPNAFSRPSTLIAYPKGPPDTINL